MRRFAVVFAALALALCISPVLAAAAPVRAVLFYSPRCGHCHTVITEYLPPLQQRYGDQLHILLVNVDEAQGATLYREAVAQYAIPQDRRGVPTMIIGDTVLVGSVEIPQQLPGLVETLLARGGSDWPALPGLAALLPVVPAAEAMTPVEAPALAETPPFLRDMPANALAVLVLAGMAVMIIHAGISWSRPGGAVPAWRDRGIPLLALAGMGVATYLALIETTGHAAVCGPVGNCNAVQQSEFARLFGIIPIGVAGVAGYGAILIAWIVAHATRGRPGVLAAGALPLLALVGTLFSIYLTFLEPFVIGATCAWCLTSAVIITALLWFSMPYRGRTAITRPVQRGGHVSARRS